MSNILNLLDPIIEDDSIVRYEYHNILPYSSTSLDNNDEIRIPIHQQDVLTLPAESRIYISGTLAKGAAAVYGANDGLSDNAMAHMFSEIRYELNGIVVDRVRNPGITSLLKGLVSFTSQDISRMSNSSFRVHSKTEAAFSYCIPLKILLGFAEDYKKVLLNVKQELVLVRSRTNNNAILDAADNLQITIKLNTVQWQVPFINVNDANRLRMMTLLEKNAPIKIPFRCWDLYEYPNIPTSSSTISWPIRMTSNQEKPRFVIVGLQTNRSENKKVSSSLFDHCSIRSMRLFIGSDSYPYSPQEAKFGSKQVATVYENFVNFRKQYYFNNEIEAGHVSVSLGDFIGSYPIWVIDCSRQSDLIKSGAVDVRLDIDASANFPANTTIYCLVINDRLIEYVPFSGIVRHLY